MLDWHECVYSIVGSPLIELQSTENHTADCPMASHLNSSTGRYRYRRQCSLLRPPSANATMNTYILLFTDRFSNRADMFPVNAAEITADGTANNR